MTQPSVLALIPARAGSKRLPGKNTRALGGRPLTAWTFDAALSSKLIGKTLLSTDDAELSELAQQYSVPVLHRPHDLAGDHASSVDVALHALECEAADGREWDIVCLLQPTSPFRAAGRIDEGIALLQQTAGANAVVGAVEPDHHPLHCLTQNAAGELERVVPMSQPGGIARSQDFPRSWALTGSFYAIRSAVLREEQSFLPPACLPLACDAPGEEIDIDWPRDFDRAEEHLGRCGATEP